jgi:hypothetical protein
MASPNITHENNSRIINVLADQRAAIFNKVWAEDGRDFTVDEQAIFDASTDALLCSVPTTRTEAGAVLEAAAEQLQLFTNGDMGVDVASVGQALLKVLAVFSRGGDYRPAIFFRSEAPAAP